VIGQTACSSRRRSQCNRYQSACPFAEGLGSVTAKNYTYNDGDTAIIMAEAIKVKQEAIKTVKEKGIENCIDEIDELEHDFYEWVFNNFFSEMEDRFANAYYFVTSLVEEDGVDEELKNKIEKCYKDYQEEMVPRKFIFDIDMTEEEVTYKCRNWWAGCIQCTYIDGVVDDMLDVFSYYRSQFFEKQENLSQIFS